MAASSRSDIGISPSRPHVALPKATSFMLAERNAWTGAPRVLVDDDACCRWIFVSFLHVPANVAAANDLCRRADSSERQSSRSRDGTKKCFPQHCHDCSCSSVLCLCGGYTASPTSIPAHLFLPLIFFKRGHAQRGSA